MSEGEDIERRARLLFPEVLCFHIPSDCKTVRHPSVFHDVSQNTVKFIMMPPLLADPAIALIAILPSPDVILALVLPRTDYTGCNNRVISHAQSATSKKMSKKKKKKPW